MRAARAFIVRLLGLFEGGRRDREMREELESHLAMAVDDNIRRGMTPEEARRAALIESGGLESAREACRDRRGLPVVESTARDVKHATRLLVRAPAFTIVAIFSLALGIGANTAIFSLLDQVVLRRLPVRDADQLQMIWTTGPTFGSNQGSRASSYPMYQDFQRQAKAFSYVFCRYQTPLSVNVGREPERVMGELVSGNYFQALGVGATVGRVFSPEEDDRVYEGHPVAVLSHQYWVARFGADAAVVGRKILVNNYPMTVVGVSAASFTGIDPARVPQIRIPIQMKPLMTPASDNLGDRRRQWVQVFARRKLGYDLEAARASLQPILSAILRDEARSPALSSLPAHLRDRFLSRKVLTESAAGGYSEVRRAYSTGLLASMAMVGLVLLIACFNVAGLLVARAAARERELAVRIALGASSARLLRQLLIESGVLSAAGAGLGLLLSVAMVQALLGFLPSSGMVKALHAQPDWRILGFAAALAVATVFLFGLVPARHAVKVDVSGSLKEGAGWIAGGRGGVRLRKALVTAQVALSFLLVAGSLLFVQTLLNLKASTSGFRDIDNLVTFQVDPARSGYSLPRVKAFYSELLERLRSLPDVRSAGYAWVQLLGGREADWDVKVEGRAVEGGAVQAWVNGVSPGYWETMGVPILEGRDFADGDVAGRPRVAIVNRAFASHVFGDASPIGRHLGLDSSPGATPDITVVGLVGDSLYEGPREGVRLQVFFPFPQLNQPVGAAFYVRGATDSRRLFAALRTKAGELDANVPVYEMKTLGDQLDETLGTERLTTTLSLLFGALATILAAVGLYGVVSLTVARRTREIGLRVALGAPPRAVLWMVTREAFALVALGIGLGIPCAVLLGRAVSSQLFGIAPGDARTALAATAALAAVACAAALVPARRAGTIDPMQALRHE